MKDDNNHITRFWDRLASGNYKEGLVRWYDNHMKDDKEEKYLFGGLNLSPDAVALEVGCGPMRNAIKFRNKFSRIDGADVSAVILDKAKIDLDEAGVPIPNLYHMNGHSLPMISDDVYDIVFMVISHQHIGCRAWRLELYDHIYRVLKSGGYFSFQTGYGSGHPKSVDYFHDYTDEDETIGRHFDVRVEDESFLKKDLEDIGFTNIRFEKTEPTNDVHPQWIWTQCQKD